MALAMKASLGSALSVHQSCHRAGARVWIDSLSWEGSHMTRMYRDCCVSQIAFNDRFNVHCAQESKCGAHVSHMVDCIHAGFLGSRAPLAVAVRASRIQNSRQMTVMAYVLARCKAWWGCP